MVMNQWPYPCRDGSSVEDWRDCKDAGKHPDETSQRQGCKEGNVWYYDDVQSQSLHCLEARHLLQLQLLTPNALARGLLPTTPSPTLDNPCEAIPEPDIPECKDLPAETPEPTPLPPTPTEESQILPFSQTKRL